MWNALSPTTPERTDLLPSTHPGQEEEYAGEVEQLLNRKQNRGRTHYLGRWKGQAPAEDSDAWEPVEHLTPLPLSPPSPPAGSR